MNLKKLEQQIGTNLKLKPVPIEIAADGQGFPIPNEEWQLDAILGQPSRLVLNNVQRWTEAATVRLSSCVALSTALLIAPPGQLSRLPFRIG